MNHQTIATAQKAIHYYQSEVGSQRVTGGSLPDNAGLMVAVRPSGTPHQAEHSHNGNGFTPAHSASQDGTQAPLQALLLIADEGVDAFPLIAAFSEGATIGPTGDSVGPGTKKTLISWDADYIDADGSLTERYVISVAATLLPEHSAPMGEDDEPGPESAASKQTYTIAADERDTLETDGLTAPTTDQEAGERGDAEENPEHEVPSREAPSANEQSASERIVFQAHTVPETGAEDDSAELETVPQSEADTAELETAPPPEDAVKSRLATDNGPDDYVDVEISTDSAGPGLTPEHDPAPEQEPEAAAAHDEDARAVPDAQEAPVEDEEHVSRSASDHSAADEEPQFPPQAEAADYTSRAGSTAVQASEEDVPATTDMPEADTPEADTPEAGTPEADLPVSTDPGPQEEAHTTPEAPETSGTPAQSAEEDDGLPEAGADASADYQEQPIERLQYEEEQEDGADRSGQDAHASRSTETATYEGDASEEAEEADSHWIHTLTQGRTSTPEQRAYLIQARNSSKLAAKLRIKRPPEQPPRLAHIDTLPEPAIERVATSPEGPGIVMPMIRKGGTGKTTVALELAFMLARLFGDDGADTPSRTGRVLLADMNLTNPDLPERLHVSGNGRAGVKDLLAGEHISRVVNRTALANLDALFLLGRGDEEIAPLMRDLSDEETMRAVIRTMVRDGGYDVLVVDTANTLPAEAENPASFVMTMWASIADARYLILQPEKAAFKNAASFVRRLGSALGDDKPIVPVLNSFPLQKVYEEAPVTPDMANRRQAAIAAVEYFQNSEAYPVVPALNARGKKLANPLIVPDYPEEVRGFAAEGRALSMYSQTFANAYRSIALDAVRRMLDNRNPQERG